MASNKELKFAISVDQASVDKAQQAIRSLISDMNRLVVESGKLGGGAGGASGGSQVSVGSKSQLSAGAARALAQTPVSMKPLVQNIADQGALVKGLSAGVKDSLKATNDAVRNAATVQVGSIKSMDRAVTELIDKYDALDKKIKSVNYSGSGWSSTGGGMPGAAAQAGGAPGVPGMTPPTGPEAAAGSWYSKLPGLRSGLGVNGGGSLGTLGSVAAIGAAIKWGVDQTVGEATGFSSRTANRVASVANPFNAMMSGDMKYAFAMTAASQNSKMNMYNLAGGTAGGSKALGWAAGLQNVNAGIGNMVGSIPILGGLARAVGALPQDTGGGIGGAFEQIIHPFTSLSGGTELAKKFSKEAENQVASLSLMKKAAIDEFSGNLASRRSVGRILGVGLSRDKISRDPAQGDTWTDTYLAQEVALRKEGYDLGTKAATVASLRSMAGEKFAGRNAFSAMAASAAGYGGWDQLLAAGNRAGSGDAFARAAIGGKIDINAGLQLGQAVIGSGFDPRGTTGGMGLLAAAQSGMALPGFGGWNKDERDFNQVLRVQAGAGLLDQVTTGGMDAYQTGRNLVDAIGRNPGGSIYANDFLANGMNLRQMMDMSAPNSKLTQTAQSLLTGTDDEKRAQIKASLNDKINSLGDRFFDTGGADSMSQTMRKYQASGMGLQDFLLKASASERGDVGTFLGQMGQNAGEEAGLGAGGLIVGAGGIIQSKAGLGGGRGEMEKKADEIAAEKLAKVKEALENNAGTLAASLENTPKYINAMDKFSADWSASADKLAEAMTGLTEAYLGKEQARRDAAERAEFEKAQKRHGGDQYSLNGPGAGRYER